MPEFYIDNKYNKKQHPRPSKVWMLFLINNKPRASDFESEYLSELIIHEALESFKRLFGIRYCRCSFIALITSSKKVYSFSVSPFMVSFS